MKKWVFAFCLFSICVSASAFVYTHLLSVDDLDFQTFDNYSGSALSSGLQGDNHWESYNQWQCFNLEVVKFDCANYDHGTLVPAIRAEAKSEVFLFDTHVEDRLDCEQTLSIWRDLVAGGSEICIYAAHMPDVDLGLDQNKTQSLWYINRLKGAEGYWHIYETNYAAGDSLDSEEGCDSHCIFE